MKSLLKNISSQIIDMKNYAFSSVEQQQMNKAIQFNEEGNKSLSQGLIDEAIMYYTKSIVRKLYI